MKYTKIVSVYPKRNGDVYIWRRDKGRVLCLKDSFKPFILISKDLITDELEYCEVEQLKGELFYTFKLNILHYRLFEESFVRIYNQKFNTSETSINNKMIGVKLFNLTEQYLLQSNNRYYEDLKYGEIKRVQIDIETTGLLNNPDAKLFMISIKSTCGFEKVIHGEDELSLLSSLNYIIKTLDPDVIENHNIFEFDIPFLLKTADKYNYPLCLSRLANMTYNHSDTYKYGGITAPFTRTIFAGREIIDTLHSARKYDADTGSFKSNCGLKNVAKVLGISRDDDSYISGDLIYKTYLSNPEAVAKYALWDVREVEQVSHKLNQSRFFLSQLVPMSYQKVCTSGSSKIVELPIVAHYLNNSYSLPSPYEGEILKNEGGLCDVFQKGLISDVIKLDVKSMYPSIILGNNITPHSDPLNYFLNNLKELTQKRLKYKKLAKTDQSYNPIQSALKIVINSSYGYLGYKYGLFNNPNGAAKVTQIGRDIARSMINAISKHNGVPIEVDTDGVICKLPKEFSSYEFNSIVQKELRNYPYIEIEPEYGEYVINKLFMYKEKSYAYFYMDDLKITGSAFKNRSEPPFLKRFITNSIKNLLTDNKKKIDDEFVEISKSIENGSYEISDLSKTVRIGKSLEEYCELKKKKLPQYEVWLNAGYRDVLKDTPTTFYKSSDEVGYRLSSEFRDDLDIEYYIKYLKQKYSMFEI